MRSKATVIVGLIGLFATSLAAIIGIVIGSNNAQFSVVRALPAPYCFEDTNPDQFSERHVATKVVACQVLGMTKAAAIDFIEARDISWRIASEDGEGFMLTEDYTDSRINLDLVLGLVVGASAW